MEAMLFVYFANILPQISNVLGDFLYGVVILTIIWGIVGGIATSDDCIKVETYKKYLKGFFIALVLVGCIKPLIPNRDTMYLMAGAYVGQQVLTSDIAKDTYEIIGLEVKSILADKRKEIQGQTTKGVK